MEANYDPLIHEMPEGERPRERLLHYGAGALSNAELIAIIIRVGTKGRSVLQVANTLLASNKGLPGIARATITELEEIEGVGPAKAIQLKAALELGRRLLVSTPEERPRVSSPSDAANLLMSEMMLLEQEQLRLILLDTRNGILGTPTIYKGSLNSSVVRIGELFRAALRENAAAMIVVHNHPSGDPSPSPEDVQVTSRIVEAGRLMDIEVLDHIVIGHQRFVSLKERGLGFE